MEKNRIRSVKTGKSMRMSYQRQEEVLEMPNLIEVQRDSYKWFLDEGLREVFDDISPIADSPESSAWNSSTLHLTRRMRNILSNSVKNVTQLTPHL